MLIKTHRGFAKPIKMSMGKLIIFSIKIKEAI